MIRVAKLLHFDGVGPIPTWVRVHVEVPRGSFVKRSAQGGIDFVSPFRCPFNYGSIPTIPSADGEPLDALVLGPPLLMGMEVDVPVRAVMAFTDAGIADPKVVCCPRPLSRSQSWEVERFFRRYALAKRVVRRFLGGRRMPPTAIGGWCPLRRVELDA